MKNPIRKYLALLLIAFMLWAGFTTELFPNLYGVLTGNGFIIPEQSSLFSFKVTQMNEGSGDYWLYGEDADFYYSTMQTNDTGAYIFIPKANVGKIENFDKTDYRTWGLDP